MPLSAAGYPVEFDGHRNAQANPGNEPEKRTQTEAVANSEEDRVGYGPRQQAKRAMLSAQEVVVSKI
jgi:hypothetical protein